MCNKLEKLVHQLLFVHQTGHKSRESKIDLERVSRDLLSSILGKLLLFNVLSVKNVSILKIDRLLIMRRNINVDIKLGMIVKETDLW